jgi:hypothetical protein
MEVNSRFVSIPPLLSVSWQQVTCLYMEDEILVITLANGDSVELPNLSQELIERLFSAHHAFMRRNTNPLVRMAGMPKEMASPVIGAPAAPAIAAMDDPSSIEAVTGMRFGVSGIEGAMGTALQHDPTMANAQDIPKDILMKFAAISKILAPEDAEAFPKAESGCNCMHCQIINAIRSELVKDGRFEMKAEVLSEVPIAKEEPILEEDLQFQQWEIHRAGEKLFNVINKLERSEQYRVYLGEPIGCTCGTDGCEHVVVVLKSPVM